MAEILLSPTEKIFILDGVKVSLFLNITYKFNSIIILGYGTYKYLYYTAKL